MQEFWGVFTNESRLFVSRRRLIKGTVDKGKWDDSNITRTLMEVLCLGCPHREVWCQPEVNIIHSRKGVIINGNGENIPEAGNCRHYEVKIEIRPNDQLFNWGYFEISASIKLLLQAIQNRMPDLKGELGLRRTTALTFHLFTLSNYEIINMSANKIFTCWELLKQSDTSSDLLTQTGFDLQHYVEEALRITGYSLDTAEKTVLKSVQIARAISQRDLERIEGEYMKLRSGK